MLWLLAACEQEVAGRVVDGDGAGVPGATLDGEGCDAVSDDAGRFRARCPRGAHAVHVTRPGYVDADATLGSEPATVTLVRYPSAPGLHRRDGSHFVPLPATPLQRREAPASVRWCLGAAELPEVPTPVALVDVRSTTWRAFRLDDDGCAWTLTRGTGDYWQGAGTVLPDPTRVPAAPGIDAMTWALEPGRYLVADWVDGSFVTEDSAAGTVRAVGFMVR